MKNEGNTVSPDVVVSGSSSSSNGRGRRKRKENEEQAGNLQARAKSARTTKTPEEEKEMIVKLVTKDLFSDDDGVVKEALKKLTNLCLCIPENKNAAKNQAAVYHAGGHTIITKILEEKRPIHLAWGCRVLGNMVTGDESRHQSVGQVGGVEAIIAALKKYPNHAYLQQCGIGALGNLISESWKVNASRLEKAGGIATVVDSMKTHAEEAPLQAHGCRTLSNLCFWREYIPFVVEAGGASVIALAMEKHKDDTRVQNYSRNALKVLFQSG